MTSRPSVPRMSSPRAVPTIVAGTPAQVVAGAATAAGAATTPPVSSTAAAAVVRTVRVPSGRRGRMSPTLRSRHDVDGVGGTAVRPREAELALSRAPGGPAASRRACARHVSRCPQAEHRTMHHRRPDRLSRITGSGTSWWQCAVSTETVTGSPSSEARAVRSVASLPPSARGIRPGTGHRSPIARPMVPARSSTCR